MTSSGTVVHFVDLLRGSVHCQGAPAKDTEALINAVAKVVQKGNCTQVTKREQDLSEWMGDPCAKAVRNPSTATGRLQAADGSEATAQSRIGQRATAGVDLGGLTTLSDTPRAAHCYDLFISAIERLGVARWRRRLWAAVAGPWVLEIGCGTGANAPHWGLGHRVTALDRSPHMLGRARRRAAGLARPAEFVQAHAESLPFEDGRFDDVVTTFVLCSVQAPEVVLTEIHRVLRAGGTLHMLEHVRSCGWVGRVMDRVANPLYLLTGDHIARDPSALLAKAGFAGAEVRQAPVLLDVVRMLRVTKP